MTYRDMLKHGETVLQEAGVVDYKLDAWYLFEAATGLSKQLYFMEMTTEATERIEAKYNKLLKRRTNREPLQYILGSQVFMGLDFEVNEHVLIPRQDTENLVEEVNKIIKQMKADKMDSDIDILDMCTGSGCIIISLAAMNEGVYGTAVDLSREAISVARRNAMNNSVTDRVEFYVGDLFDGITEHKEQKVVRAGLSCTKYGPARQTFDIIVSNPPYIPTAEIAKLMPEVGDFEPMMALDGDEDGLRFYRQIAADAPDFLKDGGYLIVEIGFDQGQDVRNIFLENNFADVRVIKDYQDNDRIVVGHL
ncbi:MAG: peptide chain release factor N(5)-glutamine methyltransferase [Lachnospiraceae bacterium]|nr:peptide chain release factor N(5)-glutamine methyltransferase [Lachnospiraceae bacterium]